MNSKKRFPEYVIELSREMRINFNGNKKKIMTTDFIVIVFKSLSGRCTEPVEVGFRGLKE